MRDGRDDRNDGLRARRARAGGAGDDKKPSPPPTRPTAGPPPLPATWTARLGAAAFVILMAAAAGVLLLAQVGDIATLGGIGGGIGGGGGGGARGGGGGGGGRLFSRASLAEYDGVRRPEMYLSILGEVFDVSSKPQFYGPPRKKEEVNEGGGGEGGGGGGGGGDGDANAAPGKDVASLEEEEELGYRVFVGRDGTRAFSTGEFTLSNATDYVVDAASSSLENEEGDEEGEAVQQQRRQQQQAPPLAPEQLLELTEWLDFYRRTYPRKGVLAGGAFYRASGRPTDALALVRAGAAAGLELRAARDARRRAAAAARPACESSWRSGDDSGEGGGAVEVWCPDATRPYPRRVREEARAGAMGEEEGEKAGGGGGGANGGSSSSPGAALKRRAERRRRERAGWRCVCFEEVGWSDLRQVYAGCSPEASRCKVVVV